MTKTTQTVRRAADISRADALKGLIAKFPSFDIVSMKEETVEYKTASGEVTSTQKNWVAEIQKAGEFTEPGMESGPAGPDTLGDEGGIPPEESESPSDGVEEPADENEAEGDEGGSEKDMLHDILSLLREMVEGPGEGAPHGPDGPEGMPSAVPGDPGVSDLPAAVKPQNGMENMQAAPRPAFAHMANRRHFFVEAHAPGQSLKSAVAELNAALAPAHRVARIKRDGAKIIAGVTRVPQGV